MSVPKKRRTSSSRKRRQSHHSLSSAAIKSCVNCGSPIKLHHACPTCGQYKGRSIHKDVVVEA